jgi:hypothetical protein
MSRSLRLTTIRNRIQVAVCSRVATDAAASDRLRTRLADEEPTEIRAPLALDDEPTEPHRRPRLR